MAIFRAAKFSEQCLRATKIKDQYGKCLSVYVAINLLLNAYLFQSILDTCISNDPISIKTSFSLSQDQLDEEMDTRTSFFHSTRRKPIKDDDHNTTQFNDDSTMMVKARVANEQNYNSAQIFGDFIADQMRQLKPHIADDLKKSILKLVLDALEKNNN